MYQVGERVVYGVHGVCTIVELQVQRVNRQKVEYYVLEPMNQLGARYFIPSKNETAVSKLRPVLTKEQVEALLSSDQIKEGIWVEDDNERRQQYRQIILNGDRCSLLQLIRTLRKHRENLLLIGKKFHVIDAGFLKDAERMLFSELSVVLNIDYDKVSAYIDSI